MKEIFKRLLAKPLPAVEILVSTLVITLMTLAMPLYVIQILNRYVTYGFHGTLITLTTGMVIAVLLQFCFRLVRTKLATHVNQAPNDQMARETLFIINQAKSEALEALSKPRIQEMLSQVRTLQQTYDAQTMTILLDAPFSLVLILFIYLLSPLLAWISVSSIVLVLLSGTIPLLRARKTGEDLLSLQSEHSHLNFSAVNAPDTVRAFNASPFLLKKWDRQLKHLHVLKAKLADYKELAQTMTMTGSTLTSVCIYAAGAVLVVRGDLSVGALIGANILSGRAYQNTTRLVNTAFLLSKADRIIKDLNLLKRLPLETAGSTALKTFQGRLEFQDLSFFYPGTTNPVFESLSLRLEPGAVLVVTGDNGSGKTTLARLIMQLLVPRRGSLLADGVNLQQIAPAWWRQQIIYMPQEAEFISATFRENLLFLNPELEDGRLNEILRITGLKSFLDQTSKGLDTPITSNEKKFPPGIRRRLSLARALAGDGRLVVLDEPTDALDQKGVEAVYGVMNRLALSGRTLIIFSNDPKILKGATMVLNLNHKPVPKLMQKQATSPPPPEPRS